MTRAREHLQLLVPQRFYVTQQSAMGDRHLYASRTRFIPDALAAQFDTVVWPLATAQGAGARNSGSARIEVRERARSIWR
jgi:DNA helicase-2/ATP-dependent DNA helicase PcrA